MKKGQITIYIILGLVLLLAVGLILYLSGKSAQVQLQTAQANAAKLPQKIRPIHDAVETCIEHLGTTALQKLGSSGGYITPNLLSIPGNPTEGDAAEYSPNSGPLVAYWWYMKSKNTCTDKCQFASKRPPLFQNEGQNSIETQITTYVNTNLADCVGTDFGSCSATKTQTPNIATHITDQNVILSGSYPISATCGEQSATVDDYYTTIPVNLKSIYTLATNLTNFEIHEQILEQATSTIIETFSGVDSHKLPPTRNLEFSGPSSGTYWLKYNVAQQLKTLLSAYIPFIQVFGTHNYNYILAPSGTSDPQLFETLYNRQFLLPLNESYDLDVHFSYLDWWTPYFDLNCNGQLCQADSGTNLLIIPFSINRYEFAYDLSYPVLVTIHDPFALHGQGYTFQFLLEENMRNSQPFTASTTLETLPQNEEGTLFCDPLQRTSGNIQLALKESDTGRGVDDVSVTYTCGSNICPLGTTTKGNFSSQFPRCIGGTLQLTKAGYQTLSKPLDTYQEKPRTISLTLEPTRTFGITIKNYALTKESKYAPWQFIEATGLSRPKQDQKTIITLARETKPYEEPFVAVAQIEQGTLSNITLVPGKYSITITSLLSSDITIPPDERCFTMKKIFSSKKQCQLVPEKPIYFNTTNPFPYGNTQYTFEFTSDMLKGKNNLEFRQYVLAIDSVKEADRTVDDLAELEKINLYSQSNPILIWPVIT